MHPKNKSQIRLFRNGRVLIPFKRKTLLNAFPCRHDGRQGEEKERWKAKALRVRLKYVQPGSIQDSPFFRRYFLRKVRGEHISRVACSLLPPSNVFTLLTTGEVRICWNPRVRWHEIAGSNNFRIGRGSSSLSIYAFAIKLQQRCLKIYSPPFNSIVPLRFQLNSYREISGCRVPREFLRNWGRGYTFLL